MSRGFSIGDKVRCISSGVIGYVVKFYTPTACEEQTMVETADGRFYHAPTRTWEKTDTIYYESPSRNIGISAICDSIYAELQNKPDCVDQKVDGGAKKWTGSAWCLWAFCIPAILE